MLEFYKRAMLHQVEAAKFEELRPRVANVFKGCVDFIQNARKKGEKITIFYIPFVSWWHYHFVDVDDKTQIGVELHQRGPRNQPIEVTLAIRSIQQKFSIAYIEQYKIFPTGKVMFTTNGDHYRQLEVSGLEQRLPLLEEVTTLINQP